MIRFHRRINKQRAIDNVRYPEMIVLTFYCLYQLHMCNSIQLICWNINYDSQYMLVYISLAISNIKTEYNHGEKNISLTPDALFNHFM